MRTIFSGIILLKAKGYDLYYWTSDSPMAEVDFLIQNQGKVIPIEVKAGENIHARSMKHFKSMYHPETVYHISERNFGEDGGVKSIPLYGVFCL